MIKETKFNNRLILRQAQYERLLIVCLLIVAWNIEARVFVPQKTYWRYQAFQEPAASTLWAYYSGAASHKAFDCCGKKSRANLADIFFNKADFFASDVINLSNTGVADALFSPRFKYNEQGVDFGYYGSWKISDKWSWGCLAELPIKQIAIKSCQVINPNSPGTINVFGNSLNSVFQESLATTGNQTYTTFAYRLDFLSKLPYACTGVGLEYPLTMYHDTDFVNLPLTLSNVDTTDANDNPVTLEYATPGTLPAQPYAVTQAVATALPPLNADGSRTDSDPRERIASGVDYTPLGGLPANQAQWWVVPTLIPVTGGQTTVFPARVIRNHVDEVVGCLVNQAENIFTQAGINFCSQKNQGIGDLVTQLFLTYQSDAWWGMRIRGGMVFPTGKKASYIKNVFKQPIGNNGHFELQIGAEFLVDLPRFAAMIYFLESHAFKRHESIATAFFGDCVKNIGLCSSADISWDAVSAGILTDIKRLGYCGKFDLLLGYQAAIKSHDHVSYTKTQAQNVLGITQQLDGHVAALKTQRQTHAFQAQLQYNVWRSIRIDGGVDYTFAGKTAPVVCNWNFGLAALF
jgi:hypothetical protein